MSCFRFNKKLLHCSGKKGYIHCLPIKIDDNKLSKDGNKYKFKKVIRGKG